MLELRGLVKHYPGVEPVRAVDGISLSISPGELVVMYGPSGSGKSTLLEMIAGFIDPDEGAVIFDGQDISRFSEAERANYRLNGIGIVGQHRSLLRGALAWENAALKLWRTDTAGAKRRIEPLLVRLGLGERIDHHTSQLSMGERQRVMLAQALSTNPKLVLADEPTGNLDSQRTREVLKLLKELCRERRMAVLLATHDSEALSFADHARELRDGRLLDHSPDRGLIPTTSTYEGQV
jgi:putative ABC transport system ATP-binding protein